MGRENGKRRDLKRGKGKDPRSSTENKVQHDQLAPVPVDPNRRLAESQRRNWVDSMRTYRPRQSASTKVQMGRERHTKTDSLILVAVVEGSKILYSGGFGLIEMQPVFFEILCGHPVGIEDRAVKGEIHDTLVKVVFTTGWLIERSQDIRESLIKGGGILGIQQSIGSFAEAAFLHRVLIAEFPSR